MKQGINEVRPTFLSSIYVDPELALTKIRKMEEILASLKGNLKICDPYIENKTIDFLSECRSSSSIKLLTSNVLKESKLRRDLAAYDKEYTIKIEVRISPNGVLHDRYILHQEGMLLLGTSLNGFAKKQSFLVSLGPDLRAATEKPLTACGHQRQNFDGNSRLTVTCNNALRRLRLNRQRRSFAGETARQGLSKTSPQAQSGNA
jgi:hypothetical protein